MSQIGLRSILSKKYIVTTDSKHNYKIYNNELNREFSADAIGKKWVSDISYVPVAGDWNYLTVILDLADRKVVGWALSQGMKVEVTILSAWRMASKNRNIKEGFIFNSDRGVQYAVNTMRNIFSFNRKITPSMSRKGNCWDNAVAESFLKPLNMNGLIDLNLIPHKN